MMRWTSQFPMPTTGIHCTHRSFVVLVFLALVSRAPGADENSEAPVRYVGAVRTSNSDYEDGYHDGQMRPALGVQNYQILRANRTHPEWSDGLGWTYNHAPMLAFAHGQFHCQYLANPTGEHIPPGVTMGCRSADGKHWTKPQMLFPIYFTARDDASIVLHHMHQRMGFYVAPNGRFLTMAFYGGNEGNGIGRVVREIHRDNALGPVFFLRPNDNWRGELAYPIYTTSPDKGFVEACQAFLSDPVRRMQWWEEDRLAKDKDAFYRVPWMTHRGQNEPGKAFCFYTRPDNAVVGFFKDRWVTVTKDQGQTWSPPVRCETLTYSGAKIWAQRLDNEQFALVYNPTDSAARHPLCIATGDDGVTFDHLLAIHGEVPPKRFWGREKRPGPQYVRGIVEGNGNPPGGDLWIVYSVSKEDIWISRIPAPVKWQVDGPIRDDFSTMDTGGLVRNWNVYAPRWCPVEVVDFPSATDKSLMLKDADPYDYAKAVRVLGKADRQTLSFDLYIESPAQVLDIEVVGARGERLMRTRIDMNHTYLVRDRDDHDTTVTTLETRRWYRFEIALNNMARCFSIRLDGQHRGDSRAYAEPTGTPERIIFRTGPYRLTDDVQEYKSGDDFKPGWDEPGADEPVPAAVYYLKDFSDH